MSIGYEQWHDGVGYDLEAIDQMSPAEKEAAEGKLIPRAENDWRDLEALDRLGTPRAVAAIIGARRSSNHEIKLLAHQYGPAPTPHEWEQAILTSLAVAEIYAGLSNVLGCAVDHPSPAVVEMLWGKVRDPESGIAYHCAAALCCIAGVVESMHDDQYRDLFLRLVAKGSEDRTRAVGELEALLRK